LIGPGIIVYVELLPHKVHLCGSCASNKAIRINSYVGMVAQRMNMIRLSTRSRDSPRKFDKKSNGCLNKEIGRTSLFKDLMIGTKSYYGPLLGHLKTLRWNRQDKSMAPLKMTTLSPAVCS
jgi:hypothetical protein